MYNYEKFWKLINKTNYLERNIPSAYKPLWLQNIQIYQKKKNHGYKLDSTCHGNRFPPDLPGEMIQQV